MERNIENLFVWQQARIVVNEIYKMLENIHDRGFKDQIQRAAVSIMNNIAEGSESGSDPKYINFLNTAKGSCSEVRSMLYLCEDLGFCSGDKRVELQNRIKCISSGIVKMINFIK